MRCGDFFLVSVGLYRDSIFDSKGGEGLLKVGSFEELPELDVALKMTGYRYDIGEVDGLFEFEGADVRNGLCGGHIGADCDEVAGHDSAGSLFIIFEKFANFFGIFVFHEL